MSKNSYNIHKKALRGLVRDDRLSPQRRLLAEMILLYIEDYIPYDMLEAIYLKKYNRLTDGKAENNGDVIHLEAKAQLSKIFEALGEENATNIDSTNTQDRGGEVLESMDTA